MLRSRLVVISLTFGLMSFFINCSPGSSDRHSSQSDLKTTNAMDNFPDFDFQGHRGARGLLPENTIPSFLIALEYGITTVEMDVVVTKDRKILVSHEPWFHQHISTAPDGTPITVETAQSHNIFKLTYEETRKYDVGKRGHFLFPEQIPMPVTKPTMKDAILAIEEYISKNELKPVFYNIETKSLPEWYDIFVPQPEEFAQLLYDELSELGVLDKVFIQSFDVRTLQEMREIDSNVPLVLLVYNENGLTWNLNELGFTPDVYSPYFRYVTDELVQRVHHKGMKIVPWTVNNPDDMIRLISLGVDGLITDYPNRFKWDEWLD